MKRSLSLPAVADSVITNRPTSPNSQNSQAANAEKPVGLFHLVENHNTLEELEYSPIGEEVIKFLRKGRLPDERNDRRFLADSIMVFNEPKLLLELLKFGNVDIAVSSEEEVARLLNALSLEPTTRFQNITFVLAFGRADSSEDIEAMLPHLIYLIQTYNFFDEIKFEWYGTDVCDLGSLYDALSGIRKLKLSMVNGSNELKDVLCCLVKLLEKNKTIHTLDLEDVDHAVLLDKSGDDLLQMLRLLRHQPLLEVFRIAVATPDSKRLIGEFIENSHSIRELTLDTRGAASAPSLIEGLKKNTSLRVLELGVDPIEQRGLAASSGFLPLISLFEKNKCSATELTLDLRKLSPDEISSLIHVKDQFNENRTVIENLLASNTTLKSLTIKFSRAISVDLFLIAKALTKNQTLESLHFEFENLFDGSPKIDSNVDLMTLPAFLEELEKNKTLVDMTIDGHGHKRSFQNDELTRILFRNDNFRKYACSFGYLNGAVGGFLGTIGLPYDLAVKISEYLAEEKPLAITKALASVNKASKRNAVEARRIEASTQLKQVLGTPQIDQKTANSDMVSLLARIATTKEDFSNDDLREVARSKTLSAGLIYWLRENPALFVALAKHFGATVGIEISRKQLIGEFMAEHWNGLDVVEGSTELMEKMKLIEKYFRPEQDHLARFMNYRFEYHTVNSNVLRFFIGYEFTFQVSNKAHVFQHCIEARVPELYLAYMENYPDDWLSTKAMPPEFRQRFLSTMLLSQKVTRLSITDFNESSDAGIVASLLSNGSGLQYLKLSNALCSRQTFDLMMEKLALNHGLKELYISFSENGIAFPVYEKISETLQINQQLKHLALNAPGSYGEYSLLSWLADTDARLDIDTDWFSEASEDEGDL